MIALSEAVAAVLASGFLGPALACMAVAGALVAEIGGSLLLG